MADPTRYDVEYSFSGYQAVNPAEPLPAPELDNELANIETALDSVADAIHDVRRSDGALKNGIVTQESLSSSLSIGFTLRGEWTLGVDYALGDGVYKTGKFYIAKVANTAVSGNDPALDSATWGVAADFSDAISDAVATMNVKLFSGDGVTTNFTLDSAPANENNIMVIVDGVWQTTEAYSVAGAVVTLVEAPGAGTNNVEIRSFTTITIGTGGAAALVSVSPSVSGAANVQTALQNINATAVNASSAAASAASSASVALTTATSAAAAASVANTNALTSVIDASRMGTGAVSFASINGGAVATQPEAESGAAADKLMTPQRTNQAIQALAPVKSVAGKTGAVTLAAADIATGVFDPTRLGTGTPSATTVLLGSGAWGTNPTPAHGDVGSFAFLKQTLNSATAGVSFTTSGGSTIYSDASNGGGAPVPNGQVWRACGTASANVATLYVRIS